MVGVSYPYQPISCSLPPTDAPRQSLQWLDLRRHATRTERLDGGIVLTLGIELAGSVEKLAAREAACCGFLSITTTRTDREIRLAITSDNPAALPVMRALAGPGEK